MNLTGTEAAAHRRMVLIGVSCAMGASALFAVNDSTIKFLSGGYALHQIILIRSVVGLALLALIVLPFQGGFGAFRTTMPGRHILRGLCVVVSNFCFFLGLAALPLADAVALFFVAPLLITALSVPLLGEKVGPRRWAAVGVGLLGVLVMLRPGTGIFQPAMLLPLVAALSYSCLHMMTRRMGGTESAATMTIWVQMCFIVTSALSGLLLGHGQFQSADPSLAFLLRGWIWPEPGDLGLLILIGATSGAGALLISQAYRSCEASIVAPFEYINMPIAILLGLLIFDEWPDAVSWIGIALICGSGLYIVWRETRVHPDVPPLAAAPGTLRSSAVEGRDP